MKLQQLFSLFEVASKNIGAHGGVELSQFDQEISDICFDTRQVIPNSVYVAIQGVKSDGHDYIQQALDKGAVALVVEKAQKIPESFKGFVLVVPDARKMLDTLASRFYHFPSENLFCFGVTGTNGKTSITYLLEHFLNTYQKTMGVMGTVNHRVGDRVWSSEMTTPDPVTLQKRLREFIQEGALYCAMEVSSHALDQKRADSVHFNTVIFTNLTLDHLDYHKDMQNYFQAKQRLFTDLMWSSNKKPLFAVVNADDAYGRRLKLAEPVVGWTYGQSESDFQFKITEMTFSGTTFELKTPIEVLTIRSPLAGVHNVYNVVACMAASLTAGLSLDQSQKALLTFKGIPGRLQKVLSDADKTVFVDYAHTPDALENTLKSLQKIKQETRSQGQVITVFGCGGDRDKTKRPLMAAIAQKYSDFVFMTSDNPRTEDPEMILNDIEKGFQSEFKNYIRQSDRELAIALAIAQAKSGDVILIAGKGHEDYQILGTTKIHFSDYEVAEKYLNQK